jgi:AraC-like DNA-binding protein
LAGPSEEGLIMQMSPRSRARSWSLPDLPGVTCFDAVDSQHTFDRHSHDEYAVGVVELGAFGLDLGRAKQVVPSQSVLVLNPGDVHTGYPADRHPVSYRMVYVAEAIFRQALDDGASPPCFPTLRIDNQMLARQVHALHRLLDSTPDPLEGSQALVATLRSLAAAAPAFAASAPVQSRREPAAIKRIKDFLHEHYAQNVRIDDLVALTRFHRAYVIRIFRQHVGMPPYTYLLQLRIEQAKRLLARGAPIAESALAVGFSDQSHLTRRFKRITGLTPDQYRQGHYHSRR